MAKRRTKTVGELGKALEKRELDLGLTREQAIERIRHLTDDDSLAQGTYYGWLRGVEPSPQFYGPLARHLEVDRLEILNYLGIITKEELTRAMGVSLRSLASIGSAA